MTTLWLVESYAETGPEIFSDVVPAETMDDAIARSQPMPETLIEMRDHSVLLDEETGKTRLLVDGMTGYLNDGDMHHKVTRMNGKLILNCEGVDRGQAQLAENFLPKIHWDK